MNLFKKKLKLTGYIYNADEYNGWGNRISWNNFEKRRIDGHLQRRPEVGDEIRFKMGSGKIARFAVTEVEYIRDPNDMFFASVMDLGYVGEKGVNDKLIKH